MRSGCGWGCEAVAGEACCRGAVAGRASWRCVPGSRRECGWGMAKRWGMAGGLWAWTRRVWLERSAAGGCGWLQGGFWQIGSAGVAGGQGGWRGGRGF